MKVGIGTLLLVAVLCLGVGFAGGWAWRRHTHPTAAEKFDEASKSLRKGLFGE